MDGGLGRTIGKYALVSRYPCKVYLKSPLATSGLADFFGRFLPTSKRLAVLRHDEITEHIRYRLRWSTVTSYRHILM
jgi:hypothetical protein